MNGLRLLCCVLSVAVVVPIAGCSGADGGEVVADAEGAATQGERVSPKAGRWANPFLQGANEDGAWVQLELTERNGTRGFQLARYEAGCNVERLWNGSHCVRVFEGTWKWTKGTVDSRGRHGRLDIEQRLTDPNGTSWFEKIGLTATINAEGTLLTDVRVVSHIVGDDGYIHDQMMDGGAHDDSKQIPSTFARHQGRRWDCDEHGCSPRRT